MESFIDRAHERRHFKTMITHSMYNNKDHRKHHPNGYMDNYHTGTLLNISKGGVVFLSDTPCRKNEQIFINHVEKNQGLPLSDITETLSGIVVWCEKYKTDKQSKFKIGVHF